ncbi:MAG: hypothetical protein U0794_03140 [Isosphaeraceae bacterium]
MLDQPPGDRQLVLNDTDDWYKFELAGVGDKTDSVPHLDTANGDINLVLYNEQGRNSATRRTTTTGQSVSRDRLARRVRLAWRASSPTTETSESPGTR